MLSLPSKDNVKKASADLGLSCDWSAVEKPAVQLEDAKKILAALNPSIRIEPESFRRGLMVELEHGQEYSEANVTNNHPLLTGKIVLAHMLELLDYYTRLDVAEKEDELMMAVSANDWPTVKKIAESRF